MYPTQFKTSERVCTPQEANHLLQTLRKAYRVLSENERELIKVFMSDLSSGIEATTNPERGLNSGM